MKKLRRWYIERWWVTYPWVYSIPKTGNVKRFDVVTTLNEMDSR